LRLGTSHAQAPSAAERTGNGPRVGERVAGPGGLPFTDSEPDRFLVITRGQL